MLLENDSAEARLLELNLVLPAPTKPAANYVTTVQAAGLVFMAGQGPRPATARSVLPARSAAI